MKIYTKQGDKGETRLLKGKKTSKSSLQVSAYGEVDELNSWIGVVAALIAQEKTNSSLKRISSPLKKIQEQLFCIGEALASSGNKEVPRNFQKATDFLEELIDTFDSEIPPLRSFILPGGSLISSYLHVCRTVCRRAERTVVKLHSEKPVSDEILSYLNRLSDLLFVLARFANNALGHEEVKWLP